MKPEYLASVTFDPREEKLTTSVGRDRGRVRSS
jgi:hypothetical protein